MITMTARVWEHLTEAEQDRLLVLRKSLEREARSKARKASAARGDRFRDKQCERCGVAFTPTNGRQLYCSPSCRRGPSRWSNPEHTDEWREKQRRARADLWANGFPFKPKTCDGCETEFVPRSGAQLWCSVACRDWVRTGHGRLLSRKARDDLLRVQDGKCALCGGAPKGWKGAGLHVDHCHKTGKVRALLCGDCNTAIGRFGDDPVRLRAAAEYLERHL